VINATDFTTDPVILFDGLCNLCHASVQTVIRRDKQAVFKYASLQSAAGQTLRAVHGVEPTVDSIILIHGGQAYLRSDAILEILHQLGGLYRIFSILRLIPAWLLDTLYNWVAGHRFAWFGRRESCMVPTPDLLSRFLS